MSWEIKTIPEADKDLAKLDGSQRTLVRKAVRKVARKWYKIPVDSYHFQA